MRRKIASGTDREILQASRDGRGGFEVFYRRHRDLILAFLAKRVRDRELAADLMAETFADALLAVHDDRRDLPDAPLPWLLTIAHRKLIDSYRRGRVQADARQRLGLEPLVIEDADLQRVDDVAADVDVLARLEAQLPADQFYALKARVLDDRAYPDIATELGCSEAVVRMRVSRALTTLRTSTGAVSK